GSRQRRGDRPPDGVHRRTPLPSRPQQGSTPRAATGAVAAGSRSAVRGTCRDTRRRSRMNRRLLRRARGLGARWRLLRRRAEAGMATAEYAIGTLAAVGLAGLLLVIVRSEQGRSLLLGVVHVALAVGG